MNEIREICAVALEAPAPPMPTAAQVLATAKRAGRWRAIGIAAATNLVIAAVTAMGALIPRMAPDRDLPIPPPAAENPAPVLPVLPRALTGRWGSGQAYTDKLIGALPAGFTGRPNNVGDVGNTWTAKCESCSAYMMNTSIVVSAEGGEGSLSRYLFAVERNSPPVGHLCSAEVTAWLHSNLNEGQPESCEVIVVSSVAIRVTTRHEPLQPNLGLIVTATRPLTDGGLQISVTIGTLDYEGKPRPHKPALASMPLNAHQLAALAADPAMLPPA